jgi:hypothetical protein
MHQHQIVISLKPEQFQQVQNLARAAGAHTVGAFIRGQLLSSLGLSSQDEGPEAMMGPDWQSITGQIRRLHRELQVFISESGNPYEYADIANVPFIVAPEDLLGGDDVPVLAQYNPDFVGEVPTGLPPPHLNSVTQQAAPTFDATSDKMEQLAEKAFAISPRLGALEQARDPLEDLLDASLLNPPQDDEEEQAENVAESGEEAFAKEYDETQAYDEEEISQETYVDEVENLQSETLQDSGEEDEAPAKPDQQSQRTTSDTTSSEPETDLSNRPPQPPPFSGGPPPRKRST